jgi:hypothetical protein
MAIQRLAFISYERDGDLCASKITLAVDGIAIAFPDYCLHSGGSWGFDEDGAEYIEQGPWSIVAWPENFPPELQSMAEDLINENVPWGCCGRCI